MSSSEIKNPFYHTPYYQLASSIGEVENELNAYCCAARDLDLKQADLLARDVLIVAQKFKDHFEAIPIELSHRIVFPFLPRTIAILTRTDVVVDKVKEVMSKALCLLFEIAILDASKNKIKFLNDDLYTMRGSLEVCSYLIPDIEEVTKREVEKTMLHIETLGNKLFLVSSVDGQIIRYAR